MDENLAKIRHERSKKDFPGMKFTEGEYVEFYFKRARNRLIAMWACVAVAIILIFVAFSIVSGGMGNTKFDEMGRNFMYVLFIILALVVIVSGLVLTLVHRGNQLLITNKRVMQTKMLSPFSSSVNIIDLVSVEDVSFRQNTLKQRILGYGTLRLSTVGDETTYTFPYCKITDTELAEIIDLVSAAKKIN